MRRGAVIVHPREHVDLLVLLVQQVLQLPHLALEDADALLERLGVAAREGAPAELVARLALEADVRTLRAAGADAVASDLLAPAAIAGLCYPDLGGRADLDDLHREDARHGGGGVGGVVCVVESRQWISVVMWRLLVSEQSSLLLSSLSSLSSSSFASVSVFPSRWNKDSGGRRVESKSRRVESKSRR